MEPLLTAVPRVQINPLDKKGYSLDHTFDHHH
jgi:hypothetical protein